MKSKMFLDAFSRYLEKGLQKKHSRALGKLHTSGGARTFKSTSDVMNVTHVIKPAAYGPAKTSTTMKKKKKRSR